MSKPRITVQGNDIVVENSVMTWFGGGDDPTDNGETSSGFSTKGHPESHGAAIPMDIGSHFPPTHGSGIPKMPWLMIVEVFIPDTGKTLSIATIDLGPDISKFPDHYLDVTKPAFIALGGNPHDGRMIANYRIVGGAKYMPQPIV